MNRFLMVLVVAVILAVGGALVFVQSRGPGAGESATSLSLDKAVKQFDNKQFQEALTGFQALTNSGSEDWRAWYYLGSTQLMLKDYPAASMALERSLALRPEEPGTLYALGVAYYKQGNLKLAKAYFGAVLEINPNDEHAKGLMDIMSKLEQNSANTPEQESAGNDS